MFATLKARFLSLLLIPILWSCDPCTDCGPITQEPTVELIFTNGENLKVSTGLKPFLVVEDDTVVFSSIKSKFILPLIITQSEEEVFVTISNKPYSLIIDYEPFRDVDIDRRVITRAQIKNVSSEAYGSFQAFDSLKITCRTSACLDKETIITCYF